MLRSDEAITPRLGSRIGAGGEAEVFLVEGSPGKVFKRYRRPSRQRAAKLATMMEHPPAAARSRGSGGITIAWPERVVTDGTGAVVGFLMPRVDAATSVTLFEVYNPGSRRRLSGAFSWRYLLRAARNLSAVVASLHEAGYVVGDLNESNLLVSNRALVAIVDCDSIQVRDPGTGAVHPCPVAKPEFTAPELQGVDLAGTERFESADNFALAVLVFLLLLEGRHPFAGRWRGTGDPPDLASRIRRRQFPERRWRPVLSWLRVPSYRIEPPAFAVPLGVLPRSLRRLVRQAFGPGLSDPARRPTAAEWGEALGAAEGRLRTCRRSSEHVFSRHLLRCPWCRRVQAGLPDPFPAAGGPVKVGPPVTRWVTTRVRRWIRRAWSAAATRLAPVIGRRLTPAVCVVGLAGATAWLAPIVIPFAVAGVLAPAWVRPSPLLFPVAWTESMQRLGRSVLWPLGWLSAVLFAGLLPPGRPVLHVSTAVVSDALRLASAAGTMAHSAWALRQAPSRSASRLVRLGRWPLVVGLGCVLVSLVIGARWWPAHDDLPQLITRLLP
ncbi:MAG TPA: hypothetical protein VE990_07970 [Acidimicrobiales bacterium]|nr:hypothetical protein [Acidimicrobiales bacterium]